MSNCMCMGQLYNPHMKIREKEKFRCCSKSPLMPREERVQVSHVLDSDSDCTDIPDSKRQQLFHTDSELGDSFLFESRFRALSNTIGFTFKFVRNVELWTKQI